MASTRNLSVFAAPLLAVAGCLTATAHAELVVNGGFEAGNFFGWTPSVAPYPLFDVTNNFGHSGTSSAFFADSVDRSITQLLPTTAGQQYQLSFYVFNGQVNGGTGDHFQVTWEGQIILDQNPILFPGSQWSLFSTNVTAGVSGSLLGFAAFDAPAFSYLDDVSVALVPAPGAAALLGAGGLLAARRRRA
ncbi:hypothetical protein BH11PLA1_BH11PLA1_13880 [soil metagenome]